MTWQEGSDPPIEGDLRHAVGSGALLELARFWERNWHDSEARSRTWTWISSAVGARRQMRHPRWSHEETETIRCLTRLAAHSRLMAGPSREVVNEIRSLPIAPRTTRPGRVNILLDVERPLGDRRYGTIWPLEVTLQRNAPDWTFKRERFPPPRKVAPAEAAFGDARAAVRSLLIEHGGLTAGGFAALGRMGGIVEFPGLALPLDGESLGLGAAMALLSALSSISLPDDIGFTGRVNGVGAVGHVDGLERKLQAAVDKGLTEIAIPSVLTIEPGEHRISVHRIATLGDAVANWFKAAPRKAIELLNSHGSVRRAEASFEQLLAKTNGRRALVSMLANNDPFGAQRSTGETVAVEDGPCLALCAALEPAIVFLLFTTGRAGAENDLSTIATNVESILRDRYGAERFHVETMPMSGVEDPTDYAAVYAETKEALIRAAAVARDRLPAEPVHWFFNASSGTPQMQTVLHMIRDLGNPMEAHLVQVRPTRKLPAGETRFRPVALPSEG